MLTRSSIAGLAWLYLASQYAKEKSIEEAVEASREFLIKGRDSMPQRPSILQAVQELATRNALSKVPGLCWSILKNKPEEYQKLCSMVHFDGPTPLPEDELMASLGIVPQGMPQSMPASPVRKKPFQLTVPPVIVQLVSTWAPIKSPVLSPIEPEVFLPISSRVSFDSLPMFSVYPTGWYRVFRRLCMAC